MVLLEQRNASIKIRIYEVEVEKIELKITSVQIYRCKPRETIVERSSQLASECRNQYQESRQQNSRFAFFAADQLVQGKAKTC